MIPRTTQLASDLIAVTDSIEDALREKHGFHRLHGLGAVSRAAIGANDPVATYYGTDLWKIAAHRESVAHDHLDAADPLGILDEAVLARARRIHQEIVQPSRAIRFASSAIARAASGDHLGQWLTQMRNRDISQVPVYEGRTYAGLLTTNAVARWLAQHVDDNGDALIESARVRDVLPHIESVETVTFQPTDLSAAEALAVLSSRNAPKALIMTASGRDIDPPQGLLVRADIAELDAALSLR